MAEGMVKDTHQSMSIYLLIEKAPAGAWTGKVVTGDATGVEASGGPQPKDKDGKALLKVWQHRKRLNGNFPGGLVGRLGDKMKEFIRINTGDAGGDAYAKKMAPLLPRIDASRDWTPAEVVALMDDIAAVTSIPLMTTLEEAASQTLKRGTPLPKELVNAPWGQPLPSGLRMAWMLEPREPQYRLGTPLHSRILIYNGAKNDVVFRTRTWHQSSGHKARDAKGAEIKIDSTDWTTIAPLVPYRLHPGQFIELNAAGIGIGANKNEEDWQGTRVGAWITAKEGDEITFIPDSVPASDWNEVPPQNGEPGWWLDLIKAHLAQELPLPTAADEREHLIYRAGLALFATPLPPEENAAFVSDRQPNALDSLAKRLSKRAGTTPFTGALTSAPSKFRVLPADPDAAKKPRIANNPGRYTLSENVRMVVSRRPDEYRVANEASIQFFSSDPAKRPPAKPRLIYLPNGYGTWAAAWERGSSVLWVMEKGSVRRFDFTDPADIKETTIDQPAGLDNVPRPILDAVRPLISVFDPPAATKQ